MLDGMKWLKKDGKTHLILHGVECVLVLVLGPVADNDTVRHDVRPFFPTPLLACEVADLGKVLPLRIGNCRKAALQVRELLLNLRSLRALFRKLCLLLCLPVIESIRVA